MLSECPIHAALPAADLERAKRLYADRLGLTPERRTGWPLLSLWWRDPISSLSL